MSAKLALHNVTKTFGATNAVDRLSLSLAEGEFLSLLGPSGCGKSTTLSMIAGFETPDSGDILIDGVRVNDSPTNRRGLGIVFQDYAVFGRLTVADNLGFGLAAVGAPRGARREAVQAIAESLRLSNALARRGGSLNMSEMQRVALGRAIIMEPKLLLLDEPMSNLDANLRLDLRGELKQIQKSLKQTILYVTHDQIEAMALSDRIAVMNKGQLVQVGTPEEIFFRPANRFVAEFIGDPPINVLPCGLHQQGDISLLSTALHKNIPLNRVAHRNYSLLVRPHDVIVSKTPRDRAVSACVRFVENYGSEHVLHLQYGNDLLRAVVPPGFASPDEDIQIGFDLRYAHIADNDSGAVTHVSTLLPS